MAKVLKCEFLYIFLRKSANNQRVQDNSGSFVNDQRDFCQKRWRMNCVEGFLWK